MFYLRKFGKKVAAIAVSLGMGLSMLPATEVQAAGEETATLRVISTTDLHGQSVNVNYDAASEHPIGSLAQVYTLIKNARKSLKYGATLTVDIGDTVYGYGSDSLMNGAITGTEYMYAEMATMGYDAITIGNHDFDYGYEYIKRALEKTHLNSKVVLSNVYAAKSRNSVWTQNKVLTKTLTTTKGTKKQVRIGVFGVTDPFLSSHYNHTGLLVTKDIVESAKEQIAILKKQKVDVIIVLAHSGIGSEEPEEMASDAVYQLSKLDGIDAIMIGDDHVNFPSTDANVAKYYQYAGVKKDGKINGKLVVGVADHGAGIGIADLNLRFKDGKVTVASKKASLKMVKSSTLPDASIVKANKSFQKKIDALYRTSLGKVSGSINNFFAMLEDNAAIQAANESKIQYGIEYTRQHAPEYADLPVIACSDYKMVGQDSANNYIDISGKFTVSDSLNVQDWNRDCTSVYWLTGAQLREWIEWRVASAYQTPEQTATATWSDAWVRKWVSKQGMTPIYNDEWMESWANYHVFDGVEYEIDITKPARYTKMGVLKNSKAHRVTSLTCNGVPVTDAQRFVIVCSQITSTMPVISGITGQKIMRGNMKKGYNNVLLQEYVKQQSEQGAFNVSADNNWKVLIPEATNYLVKSSAESELVARSKSWYIRTLDTNGFHNYYQAALGQEQKDAEGPLLVLGIGNKKTTNHNVQIAVQASDVSKVVLLKYYPGVLQEDSALWSGASSVLESKCFEATGNGTYSVLAQDAFGNRTVKYITVSNMDSSILEAPDVDSFTNRKRRMSGKTDPGLTVYVQAAGKIYETVADENGQFVCELPLQKAESKLQVWVQNASGRCSKKVDVIVGRTGANEPLVDNITNKLRAITGKINDSSYCKVVAIVNGKVYVPKKGGKESYKNSAVYDQKYTIVETDFSIKDGRFSLAIPVLNAGTPVKVYSIDWIDRASVVSEFKTKEVAPNMPVLRELYAVDDRVFGKIPAVGNGTYTVSVNDGTKTYTAVAKTDGTFEVEVGKLSEGAKLTVTASDVINGKERTSAKADVKVSSYKSLLTPYTDISFDEINSKSTLISGHMTDYTGKINLLIGTTRVIVTTDENGNFSYALSKPRTPETPIVAMVRETDGTVWDICETTVKLAIPDAPELITDVVYDTTTELRLFCADQATAVVKIGGKYYKTAQGVYDKKRGGYVYTITLKKAPKADAKVIAYMMNKSGKSERVTTVVEADPEATSEKETKTK